MNTAILGWVLLDKAHLDSGVDCFMINQTGVVLCRVTVSLVAKNALLRGAQHTRPSSSPVRFPGLLRLEQTVDLSCDS
jgi:hypothetical protein